MKYFLSHGRPALPREGCIPFKLVRLDVESITMLGVMVEEGLVDPRLNRKQAERTAVALNLPVHLLTGGTSSLPTAFMEEGKIIYYFTECGPYGLEFYQIQTLRLPSNT